MKKLDKQQLADKTKILEALQANEQNLEISVGVFNSLMATEWEKVKVVLEKYNESIDDASSFRDEITQEMVDFSDNKSDKWLESDAGQNFLSWKSEWEDLDITSVNIFEPTELDQ